MTVGYFYLVIYYWNILNNDFDKLVLAFKLVFTIESHIKKFLIVLYFFL